MVLKCKPSMLRNVIIVMLLLGGVSAQAQMTNGERTLQRLTEAVAAINDNQLDHAEMVLNDLLASSPADSDALNLLGVVRAKQERKAEAEKLFRRALVNSPKNAGAYINLSELLLTTNRSAEALSILVRGQKLSGSIPAINLKIATLYAGKGNYQQALGYLNLLPAEAFTDDYFLLMLRSLIGLKRLESVPALTGKFRQANGLNPATQTEFAVQLAKAGFNNDALEILNDARTKAPSSFPVLYGLGVVTAALKDNEKANEYLTAALAIKPDDVANLRALARVARATGNPEKALAHLVEARRLAPKSPLVLYDFGVTALQMDLLLDALPVFEQLQRDYPREPAYLYALAAAHWRKGETAETTRLMNQYVNVRPRDSSGWYLLGAALLRQERTSEAHSALQKSLSLKADPDTEYLLGVSIDKLGNRAAAIKIFQKIVQARPEHAAAHAALGTAYREAGSYAEARSELERAVDLDADDLRANYQLGLVYAKLGEKEAAKKMFDRADELRKRQHDQERVILKLLDQPQL